jgi:hypothetical protein
MTTHIVFKGILATGVVFTPLGAFFEFLVRGLKIEKAFRHGRWRQTLLDSGPNDVVWYLAKPFFWGGLACLIVGGLGLAAASL